MQDYTIYLPWRTTAHQWGVLSWEVDGCAMTALGAQKLKALVILSLGWAVSSISHGYWGVFRSYRALPREIKAKDNKFVEVEYNEDHSARLPLEVMIRPVEIRGTLDFPHNACSIYLQPILREQFQRSNLAMTSMYIESTSALITASRSMIHRKVFALIAQIS